MAILKARETQFTRELSESEKALGVDLKLTEAGDLEINNRGDINMIKAADNAAQALFIKLGIEPGSLVYHPTIGTNLGIGTKVTSAAATRIKTQILKSISGDPRFLNTRAKVDITGNTVIIDINVTLSNTGEEVPIQFALADTGLI